MMRLATLSSLSECTTSANEICQAHLPVSSLIGERIFSTF